ncbi:ribonuclease P protein component [Bacillus alkalicellulosilyticus]|uniref:ribonuclease P protein component n=1 Tax=Alkalihalobacterium alkalicellulosilyticum TaxID=1912214 RepID=UPI00099676EF|nr:ribonuclease P protein component [Bacillus alkalicellulosilyticus]
MKKEYRIKKNNEFSFVFNEGKSVANRQFVLYTAEKKGQEHFRFGLSVSKKVGNAVVRNRVKRVLREVFKELEPHVKKEFDYVVVARKPAADMEYSEIKKSMVHVLRRARVLKSSYSNG